MEKLKNKFLGKTDIEKIIYILSIIDIISLIVVEFCLFFFGKLDTENAMEVILTMLFSSLVIGILLIVFDILTITRNKDKGGSYSSKYILNIIFIAIAIPLLEVLSIAIGMFVGFFVLISQMPG